MPRGAADELTLTLDTRIYPVEAVRAAAETFADRAILRIRQDGASGIAIRFKAKAGASDLEALSDSFHNELLHEVLRLRVSRANQKLREYIVTKALVSAQETQNVLPQPAPVEVPCSGCSAETAAPPVDATLEKEIAALLTEIEQSEPGAGDPLGVAVSWEEKHAGDNAAAESPERKVKEAP